MNPKPKIITNEDHTCANNVVLFALKHEKSYISLNTAERIVGLVSQVNNAALISISKNSRQPKRELLNVIKSIDSYYQPTDFDLMDCILVHVTLDCKTKVVNGLNSLNRKGVRTLKY